MQNLETNYLALDQSLTTKSPVTDNDDNNVDDNMDIQTTDNAGHNTTVCTNLMNEDNDIMETLSTIDSDTESAPAPNLLSHLTTVDQDTLDGYYHLRTYITDDRDHDSNQT